MSDNHFVDIERDRVLSKLLPELLRERKGAGMDKSFAAHIEKLRQKWNAIGFMVLALSKTGASSKVDLEDLVMDWHQAEVNLAVTEALEEVKVEETTPWDWKESVCYDFENIEHMRRCAAIEKEKMVGWNLARHEFRKKIDAIKARYGQGGSDE